jgi:hypothetical protein
VAFAVLRPSLERSIERAAGRSSDRLADRAAIEQLWTAFEDLGRFERHVIAVGDDDDEDRIAGCSPIDCGPARLPRADPLAERPSARK